MHSFFFLTSSTCSSDLDAIAASDVNEGCRRGTSAPSLACIGANVRLTCMQTVASLPSNYKIEALPSFLSLWHAPKDKNVPASVRKKIDSASFSSKNLIGSHLSV